MLIASSLNGLFSKLKSSLDLKDLIRAATEIIDLFVHLINSETSDLCTPVYFWSMTAAGDVLRNTVKMVLQCLLALNISVVERSVASLQTNAVFMSKVAISKSRTHYATSAFI